MDREKVEVIRPPIVWQERVEEILLEDMPDAPYFASWVAEHINWKIPVVNPWDYSKTYKINSVSFHSAWVKTMARMCEEYLKIKEANPGDPDVWYVHKAVFGDGLTEEIRSFYKMRHWGLFVKCPNHLADKQLPVAHPETGAMLTGCAGRFQPTDHMFAFLTNSVMLPFNCHILRNQLVGMSGHYINMSRALSDWRGFNRDELDQPPVGIDEPECAVCHEVKTPFIMTEYGDVFCTDCMDRAKSHVYTELVKPIKTKLKRMKKKQGDGRSTADRLAAGWKHQFEQFYQPSKNGIQDELTVDMDIGHKGAIALSEAALRRFLIRREKKRRKLAEQRAKKEKDNG